MDGEVGSTEERKAALELSDAKLAALQGEVLGMLQMAIGDEVLPNLKVIAQAIVKLATEGHGPSVKLLIEILQDLAKNRTRIVAPIMRSLAEEWGVEPDWSDGCCIHCAKMSGDRDTVA